MTQDARQPAPNGGDNTVSVVDTNMRQAVATIPVGAYPHGLRLEWRRFPDGESYVRFTQPFQDDNLAMVCTLNDPDAKALALRTKPTGST